MGPTDDSDNHSGWNIDDLLISGRYNFTLLDLANVTFTGEYLNDSFGWSVGWAGDVDSDTVDDIIIGAPGARNASGNAYVFLGGTDLTSENLNYSDTDYADIELLGATSGDLFGFSVGCAGDLNDDAIFDFVVGAPFNDSSALDSGAAYVFYGRGTSEFAPTYSALNSNVTLKGARAGDNFGWSVGGNGNINNDDKNDTYVGAPHFDNTTFIDAGMAYVYCIPEYSDLMYPLILVLIIAVISRCKSKPNKKRKNI
jgi:hypothetical protein